MDGLRHERLVRTMHGAILPPVSTGGRHLRLHRMRGAVPWRVQRPAG
jgi:hypothetical protein